MTGSVHGISDHHARCGEEGRSHSGQASELTAGQIHRQAVQILPPCLVCPDAADARLQGMELAIFSMARCGLRHSLILAECFGSLLAIDKQTHPLLAILWLDRQGDMVPAIGFDQRSGCQPVIDIETA